MTDNEEEQQDESAWGKLKSGMAAVYKSGKQEARIAANMAYIQNEKAAILSKKQQFGVDVWSVIQKNRNVFKFSWHNIYDVS